METARDLIEEGRLNRKTVQTGVFIVALDRTGQLGKRLGFRYCGFDPYVVPWWTESTF